MASSTMMPVAAQRSVAATRSTHCLAACPRLVASKLVPFTAAKPMAKRSSRSSTALKVAAVDRIVIEDAELPADYSWYETMIILRPTMNEEQRDLELAKFEAFLKNQNVRHIKANVRGRQRLAYPIKRFVEGIYVLYTYAAPSHVSQQVQKNLSTPDAGNELNILRHMTFRVAS